MTSSLLRRDVLLDVVSPQVLGDGPRVPGFVEGRVLEADGVAVHRSGTACLHQCHDRVDESTPPDRKAPTGTSETVASATAAPRISSSTASASLPRNGSADPTRRRRAATSRHAAARPRRDA